MGELLLVCSLVTLILLVLYINKKKQEERQFYAELQSRKHRDSNYSRRYSRDDSMLHNKRSPIPGDSLLIQRDRYRNYSPIYDREKHNKNYDYFNTSNQFNKSFLTPTNLNDTYDKYEKEKRNIRNLMRSDDVDLPTEKFPQNTSNNKNNPSNFNFANEFAKFNSFNQQTNSNNNLTKSQSFPVFNQSNNIANLNNGNNGNSNQNLLPQPSDNPQAGYKVIKLEDFLSSENNLNSASPMFKNKPKITLDDVNPSLIKYLHKNDENYYNQNFPVQNFQEKVQDMRNNINNINSISSSNLPYQIGQVKQDNKISNMENSKFTNQSNNNFCLLNQQQNVPINSSLSPFKPLSSQRQKDLPQSENIGSNAKNDSLVNFPKKKLQFSDINTIQKNSLDSECKPIERVLNFTPTAKKEENIKFESFGDHQTNINNPNQDETLKSINSYL